MPPRSSNYPAWDRSIGQGTAEDLLENLLRSALHLLVGLLLSIYILDACSKDATPCVLIASKCDAPISSRRIDPHEVQQLCMEETGIESVEVSMDYPDTHKRCISVILRSFVENQIGKST